ncbi:MAG: hypothetical protein QXP53_01345 [Candidatus Pacearchaeota archaeon]
MKRSLVGLLFGLVLLSGCADEGVNLIKTQHKAIKEKNFQLFLSTLSESRREQYSNVFSQASFMSLEQIYLKKIIVKKKYDGRMTIITLECDKEGREFRKNYSLVKEGGWRISSWYVE